MPDAGFSCPSSRPLQPISVPSSPPTRPPLRRRSPARPPRACRRTVDHRRRTRCGLCTLCPGTSPLRRASTLRCASRGASRDLPQSLPELVVRVSADGFVRRGGSERRDECRSEKTERRGWRGAGHEGEARLLTCGVVVAPRGLVAALGLVIFLVAVFVAGLLRRRRLLLHCKRTAHGETTLSTQPWSKPGSRSRGHE